MKPDKVLSMLGLAAKAGRVVSGEFSTEKAVKAQKAYLVIVAEDASANTRKRFKDMCSYYQVPILFMETREILGKVIGKEFRASIAVLDAGFAKAMLGAEGQQKKEECLCQK